VTTGATEIATARSTASIRLRARRRAACLRPRSATALTTRDGVPDDGATCFTLDGSPIAAIETSSCGDAWYSYGVPDDASAAPTPDVRVSSRVTVVIVDSPPSCGGAASPSSPIARTTAAAAPPRRVRGGGTRWARFVVGDEPTVTFDLAAGVGSCGGGNLLPDGVLIGRLGTTSASLSRSRRLTESRASWCSMARRVHTVRRAVRFCGCTPPAVP
jgi:hypothetical protein